MPSVPPLPPMNSNGGASSSTALVIVPNGSGTPRTMLSSSRAKYAISPRLEGNGESNAAPTLSPRDLREISKFIDSNKHLGHNHRSANISTLIPKGPFVRIRPVGDQILQLSVAPVHPKESALDVPLRLSCPDEYHAPVMTDPRSNGTIAARIASLLKGAAAVPVHWDGESLGPEKDMSKLNAIRDSDMRATAANRAQNFVKEAQALCAAGAMHYNSGNLTKAISSFSTAVQRFEVVGDAQGVAFCHNILGVCHYRAKDYKMALLHHKKQQVLSANYGKSLALINLGVSYSALGELQFAEQAFQDSLACAMEAQDPVLETIALGNLGLTYMRLGEVRKSQSNMEQCLEHCSVAGDRVGSAVCLLLLGEIYSIVDDSEHALFYYEHGFRVSQEAGCSDLQEIARVSIGIAKGNKQARESMTAFAKKMGKDVGLQDLLLSLPHH